MLIFGDIKPDVRLFDRNGGSKWPKVLPFLDQPIDSVPHTCMRRISQYTSVPERPRPVLHSPSIPRDYAAFSDELCGFSACRIDIYQSANCETVLEWQERSIDIINRIGRPE
jgi:hypothetical protein